MFPEAWRALNLDSQESTGVESGGVESTGVQSTVLDTSSQPGLEAAADLEALMDCAAEHGAAVDRLDEPLMLYRARRKAVQKMEKRMLWILAVIAMFIGWLAFTGVPWWPLAALGYGLAIVAIYALTRRSLERTLQPILKMDQRGLHVHSIMQVYFVPWDEIKSVRQVNFIHKYIGIMPQHLFGDRIEASAYHKFIYSISLSNLMFGLAPILVPVEYLPLDGSTVVNLIEERRQYHTRRHNNSIVRKA